MIEYSSEKIGYVDVLGVAAGFAAATAFLWFAPDRFYYLGIDVSNRTRRLGKWICTIWGSISTLVVLLIYFLLLFTIMSYPVYWAPFIIIGDWQ